MCSQRWPLSQEANKAKGTCSVCFEMRQLHLRDNTVHLHGPRATPCLGSNRPPLAPQFASQGAVTTSRTSASEGIVLSATSSSVASTAIGSATLVPQSQCLPSAAHPLIKCPIIKHVPKSARPSCCSALAEILSNIVRNKTELSAWVKLFHFCPSVLSIPPKSGSNSSVSSIIKARLTSAAGTASAVNAVVNPISRKRKNESALAAAVSSKVEDGNIKAALRLLCSEDAPADFSNEVFKALLSKHPPPASDSVPSTDPRLSEFSALQVPESTVLKALKSFPAGSSGGPDGLRPQHLVDLVSCKTGGPALLTSLTGFVNLILDGGCPDSVRPILFGARLIAIEKKSGGIRPIAVGYTVRRLVAKCANTFAQEQLADYFSPVQLGVAVSGGCEAAVHATRRFVTHMKPGEAVVKLDFTNAFNSIRRDAMLRAVSNSLPQIYKFCCSSYSSPSTLQFGDRSVVSAEGVQQGDPLGPLLFCLTIHPLLTSLSSNLRIGYLDDVTLGGDIDTVSQDVTSVQSRGAAIGLCLNTSKCEFISESECPQGLSVSNFKHTSPGDATLLGAPLLEGSALDNTLLESHSELYRCQNRLPFISAHDALLLLKSSLSTPRLTHLLRASPCSGHSALYAIDDVLRSCVSRITNTELSDGQWAQASLPVKAGGLGVRLAKHLAPSAFLSAAYATRELQSRILQDSSLDFSQPEEAALKAWSDLANAASPSGTAITKQREWDKIVVQAEFNRLLQSQSDDTSKARLLAVSAPHSGDWLHAIPISNCGLRLDDEAIRVAVGLRLGTRLCATHTCVCNELVEPNGLHSFSCKKDSARILRHNALNDIVHRSLLKASVPSMKEPPGLMRSDGKRPDGTTLIPWVVGKCLAWDVTVTNTLASSYVSLSANSACSAAERAALNKTAKYTALATTHEFVPIAIETLGPMNASGLTLLSSIGKLISLVSGDPRETSFLFQRISICLQRYNSLSLRSSFGDLSTENL